MPFVKLDCGILNSTLWIDRVAREVFITSLLMAEPRELLEPMPQIAIGSLDYTGWNVPAGWYGFVEAASTGIIHRAGYDDRGPLYASACEALHRLGEPDPDSRSRAFDGRRLVRVNGGFIVLNFINYRDKDATTADRSRRWRERQKQRSSRVTDTPTRVIRHQAEAEAEAEVRTRTPAAPANSPVEKIKPEQNLKLITVLVSKELIPNGVDEQDLIEETKRACAKRRIAYNSQVVRKAVDSALAAAR